MDNNFSLGKRLRELRSERALSQEQIANMAEISAAYLGQVERGTKNVTVHTLEKICIALNVSLADFFCIKEPEIDNSIDETSNKILHQLVGKTEEEKRAVLNLIKLVFSIQNIKNK